MSNVAKAQRQTEEALIGAIEQGRFPGHVKVQADELRSKLTTPARITLFGLPDIGKSSVLNLLAGSDVVPEGVDLGTVQLTHGAAEKSWLTLADGSTQPLRGLPNAERLSEFTPVLTRIEAPLPALAKISLMEPGRPVDHEGQKRAIEWAAKQTDIAIWCTESYTDLERDLWHLTPPRLSDHGILLRTRCDLLESGRDRMLSALHQKAGDEFAHVLGISAREAKQASVGGQVDKEKMRASGGMKLISTLLQEIEKGRQHLVDQADILLRMHPEPKVAPSSAVQDEPIAAPVAKTPVAPVPQEPVVETPAPTVAVKETPQTTPEAVIVAFQSAADRLSQVGADLAGENAPEPRQILDASVEALNWLGEHLEDADLPDTPTVAHVRNLTQDADDLVQLLRIEGPGDGGTDAILALLQLKRGFQAAIAA